MYAAGMISRVRQEVSIHSKLKHPSVLELYFVFEDFNYVYLVLEYCENGELQRFLKQHNKVLSESEGKETKSTVSFAFHKFQFSILNTQKKIVFNFCNFSF